jgi:hypothetical protein
VANNTNQQAVAFDNNYARVGANTVVSCYLTMVRTLQVWNGQNLQAVIPNDANLVDDGSIPGGSFVGQPPLGNGRAPVTDAQIQTMIANMTTLVASFTANSNLILNQFLQIATNGTSAVQ